MNQISTIANLIKHQQTLTKPIKRKQMPATITITKTITKTITITKTKKKKRTKKKAKEKAGERARGFPRLKKCQIIAN
ncbi:MAG: hypothetical protein IJI21_01870 [Clostridia bacterium]|nr:hypothetical protein [Clostridia bacterium]